MHLCTECINRALEIVAKNEEVEKAKQHNIDQPTSEVLPDAEILNIFIDILILIDEVMVALIIELSSLSLETTKSG